MIHVVLGTKAQLVKMAPLMRRLQERQIPYNFVITGQHRETIDQLRKNFDIKDPDCTLYQGKDIVSITALLFWVCRIVWATVTRREEIFCGDRDGIVLVHGDTFSTLLGALMGRVARLQVGHVESGLRSFRVFQPFPEELTRLAVFRLSHFYFCPGQWAVENVARYRGRAIDTQANTLYDALRDAVSAQDDLDIGIPDRPYVVVTTHRFENLFVRRRFEQIIALVLQIADRFKTLFILHAPTARVLEESGARMKLEGHPNIELRPRYDYFRFVKLVNGAEFVVTDGGSNQEETYYLGKPTLLLRNATERQEGLGETCIISNYDEAIVANFIESYADHRRAPVRYESSPSEIIIREISRFIRPRPVQSLPE